MRSWGAAEFCPHCHRQWCAGFDGGYTSSMNTLDENLVRDTICGLELQLIDAVERQERAEVQHDTAEADRIQGEIAGLQGQLADVAEAVARLDA